MCVRVLGGFELTGAGGGDLTLSGKKLRALIALLVLPPSLGWSREQVTALLWGDRDEELARGSLRQALAELRRVLGDAAVVADRETVALDPAFVTSDAADFAALSAAGQWDEAVALYRGDLLTGISLPNGAFADWLLVERTRLHDLAVRLLIRLLERRSGDAAIATALRLQDLDPDREETYRTLMRLYAAKGDRSQALRQYQLCRDRLQRELGVRPEPETERLLERIRLPAARAAPARQPDPRQAAVPASDGGRVAAQPADGAARRRWRGWAAAGLTIALLSGLSAAAWLVPGRSPPNDGGAAPASRPPSIAVLPFANMSDDPRQVYFADGIAEDLMTDLSRVNGLEVIARNSAVGYRNKDVDVRDLARELGVRYVINGSVRRSGDEVRINVQLVDAPTGNQQWAQRYDGSLADIFALQDQVTSAVVNAMALRLTAGEQRELARHETTSLQAYDAFLRGWERYKRATPEDLVKAIPYFEQAIELDASYGRAHAAMAMIYFQAHDQAWTGSLGISADDVYRKARDHLKIAQKRPTSTSHQVAGSMSRARGWHEDALKEFDAAIALDPNDSWSYAYAAHALLAAGEVAKAEARIHAAMRLDPHPPAAFVFYQGLVEFAQDRPKEAAATFERAAALSPDDPLPQLLLVAAYGVTGDRRRALESLASFNALRVRQGGIPLTADCYYLSNLSSYKFGQWGLWGPLLAAGVPRWFGAREFDRHRLRPEEVDALFFGHRIHGRSLETGEEHGISVAADGTAIIFGDWGYGSGRALLDGDQLCFEAPGGYINCAAIYRNPGGARAKENEFVWANREGGAYPFSVVE
jgi:TolB-like protein/DNA-binding SARP family transcriptional activator